MSEHVFSPYARPRGIIDLCARLQAITGLKNRRASIAAGPCIY